MLVHSHDAIGSNSDPYFTSQLVSLYVIVLITLHGFGGNGIEFHTSPIDVESAIF
jgi:hypothetical protein